MGQHTRPPDGPEGGEGKDVSPADPLVAKREQLTHALEQGRTQIRLDARYPGVAVPSDHRSDYALALNLSWQFPKAAMIMNEKGIAATLHFSGRPFRCVVPWPAVWGMLPPGSTSLYVWPLDLPPELGGSPRGEIQEQAPVEPMKPQLRLIETEPALGDEEQEGEEKAQEGDVAPPQSEPSEVPASEERPKAPWLRLVR